MPGRGRGYRLTVRTDGRVRHERFDSLEPALSALDRRVTELARGARRGEIDLKLRRFEPVQQVTARIELAGPERLRAGVDVRGDGSAEAYTGRLRRRLIEQRGGEDATAALRRTIGSR